MCNVLWDNEGLILIGFLQRDETVNSNKYQEIQKASRCNKM